MKDIIFTAGVNLTATITNTHFVDDALQTLGI